MDVGIRLGDSVRRFQIAKHIAPTQGLRAAGGAGSVRRLVGAALASFAPSQLPMMDPLAQCTAALAEFASDGSYRFRADVVTPLSSFVVLAIGFAFSVGGRGDAWVAPLNLPNRVGPADALDERNPSSWLRQNWNYAMSQGLSFGMVTTTDTNMTFQQLYANLSAQFANPLTFMQDDNGSFSGSALDALIAAGGDPFEQQVDEGDASDTEQSFRIRFQTVRPNATLASVLPR